MLTAMLIMMRVKKERLNLWGVSKLLPGRERLLYQMLKSQYDHLHKSSPDNHPATFNAEFEFSAKTYLLHLPVFWKEKKPRLSQRLEWTRGWRCQGRIRVFCFVTSQRV